MNNIKLIKLSFENINEILNLYLTNLEYFKFDPPIPSYNSVKNDLIITPKGIDKSNKYFLGAYLNNELIGVIDLITNYPNSDSIFIGLLMINKNYQNQGFGSLIINLLTNKFKNFKYINLGVIKGNDIALNFYLKNKFTILKIINKNRKNIIYFTKKIN